MEVGRINCSVVITNLNEYEELIDEAKRLTEQLRKKQEQISEWRPITETKV